MIDSNVGTLHLTECLDKCRSNPQCRAINYETGLCVLFRTAVGENSDLLAKSQFPVFTLYAQKVCHPEGVPACSKPWQYETVPDLAIRTPVVSDFAVYNASSRAECVELCLAETNFTCRSASFETASGPCILSPLNRHMTGRRAFLDAVPGASYSEMSCLPAPEKMCQFTRLHGKILKTVDAVYQDLKTTEECKERCLKANFTCRSFDFMSAGERICRLSHHSSNTLAHITDPYLMVQNSTTHELQACYQVEVECNASEMVARISTTTLFDGKVYAKDRPNSCKVDIESSTDFSISLPYNDVRCDVTYNTLDTFTSNIVIQHHDMIVTAGDVGVALHCRYDIRNTTVTNSLLSGLQVKSAIDTTEFFREGIVDSPNVIMRVTNTSGHDLILAKVGDNIALRFEITDQNSPYEIFVRQLVATDGSDNSEITLIDDSGCPTDPTIMQHIKRVQDNGTVLEARFQAFKFPSSDVVQFTALVTPCFPNCEPAECVQPGLDDFSRVRSSFGKRKRREVHGHEADVLVAQSVRITDRFEFTEKLTDEDTHISIEAQGSCSSFTGVVVAGALFLAAQLVMLMAWSYLWHKKRATKQIDPMPPTPSIFHRASSAASRASSTSYLTD